MLDGVVTEKKESEKISRREFLKKMGMVVGGGLITITSLSELGRWLMSIPDRQIAQEVIKQELTDNMELGELNKQRVEYFFLWPYARIWVVVNNLIAFNKLNGQRFERGKTYSLVKLLALEADYSSNIDPTKGYIAGLSLEGHKLTTVESQGLSLTANALARTLALAPVKITEWHTHTFIDQFTRYYFDPTTQILSHPVYKQLGSDATVFCGKQIKLDLCFIPQEDLVLKTKIINLKGKELRLPNLARTLVGYPESLTMRLTTPILVRMAVGTPALNNYSIRMHHTQRKEVERIRPGFNRKVLKINRGKKTLVSSEEVFAYYDSRGKFFPTSTS